MHVDIQVFEQRDGFAECFGWIVAAVLGEPGFDYDDFDDASGLRRFRKRKKRTYC